MYVYPTSTYDCFLIQVRFVVRQRQPFLYDSVPRTCGLVCRFWRSDVGRVYNTTANQAVSGTATTTTTTVAAAMCAYETLINFARD